MGFSRGLNGLLFPGECIKANYDIQSYLLQKLFLVHRIGRTGRSGRTGLATTFINKSNDESVLLDLKHLLMEAKQKVPTFLAELCSENEKYLNVGGNFIHSLLNSRLMVIKKVGAIL